MIKDRVAKKIAFLGLRGIPASYGGFETFVEEIGTRLARQGFDITVYCRKEHVPREATFYKGIRLIQLPTIRHKYFHSVFHSLISTIHVMFSDCQVVYYCGTINSVFCFLPRLCLKKTVINVDGLEWKRKKWGNLGKIVYKISECLATWLASEIICDSKEMAGYYWNKFKKKTHHISYGGSGKRVENTVLLFSKYGLEPRKYFLYVSRLEPENNAHLFVKAFEGIKTDMPFIVVGDAPYARSYVADLHATKDRRIKFLGYVFGDDYRLLTSHAYIYFHGNEVGGTNPGLVEAMAMRNCIIAIDGPFNREVIGDTGFFFRPDAIHDLREHIDQLMRNSETLIKARDAASERAQN